MDLREKRFAFVSGALDKDAFEVVSFKGLEGISTLYKFEITLASHSSDINMKDVVRKNACLKVLQGDITVHFNGIINEFDLIRAGGDLFFYRAILVPRLWRTTRIRHNQVFLNKTVPDVIKAVLKDAGLFESDYEMKLQNTYPTWEYICQYGETHYAFISRWMEREGLYFYFEQGKNGEKLVITDTMMAHARIQYGDAMVYAPPSGLDEEKRDNVIQSLVCRVKSLPGKIILKDYNYLTPSLELLTEKIVSEEGEGDVYLYGELFRDIEEGRHLAEIRAQEYLCLEKTFHGESLVPYLSSGFTFNMDKHFKSDFNTEYLCTEIEHSGSQTGLFLSALGRESTGREKEPSYRNTFSAILSATRFRPRRTTQPAKFYGTMNAKIDGETDGQYAELDSQGRYKVKLPFDLSDTGGGKASAWIRMAQPYAGANYGMHFPLHKGTEVLLSFIDGNPDRPYISAAIPNPATSSPVIGKNETQNVLSTAGRNRMVMEDEDEQQYIRLSSPTENTMLHLGAEEDGAKDNIVLSTDGHGLVKTKEYLKTEVGDTSVGTTEEGCYYLQVEETYKSVVKDYEQTVQKNYKAEIGPGAEEPTREVTVTGNDEEHVTGKQEIKVDGDQELTVKGKQEITVNGNREITVSGTEDSLTVKGKKSTTVTGDWEIMVKGHRKELADEETWWTSGMKAEGYGGLSFELFLGIKIEVNIGPAIDISLGIPNIELSFALKLALTLSFAMEAAFGGTLSLHEGVKINKHGLEVHAVEFTMENKAMHLENEELKIEGGALKVVA